MTKRATNLILTFSCPDQFGVVAAVAAFLADQGCNIEQSAQHADHDTGLFFMRVEFSHKDQNGENDAWMREIETAFSPIKDTFEMTANFYDPAKPVKAIILVSKGDHCLNDVLHRVTRREFNLDVRSILSNHTSCADLAAHYGVAFEHLPVSDETRPTQEGQILDRLKAEGAELLILARYMQILSDDMCQALGGKAINIHHSFLPSFKGARPYHQAYNRGVKLIGATAHFVTKDLDEGPIIEQEAERVDSARNVDDFIRIGRDVERRTLAQALRFYCERRVLMNGVKTVVFR